MRNPVHTLRHLTVAVGVFCMLVCTGAGEDTEPLQPYRVIFNCDGHAVAKDADGDLDQWIKNLFDPLEESHVDALFWCDGAGGNTANYDSQVLERTGARSGQPRTYIDDWIAEGNDPPRIVVREARKRNLDVFYSLRLNDIHDSFIPDEMPTFKAEHPDWMLGEQQYGEVTSFKTALNFAVPEVRDLKFRVIEELFEKYEFDGLEIDFLRSSPYFLPGTEAENAHLLTELLQRTRDYLDRRSREQGRPIWLAVRVNESREACALDGFDVQAWIENDLVDIVTLGSGVMDIEVDEFRELAEGSGVLVYPCLYGWPSGYNPIPEELAAGLALNYHAQGADGIYLFNWFPHTTNNSESTGAWMASMLNQLGDPDRLLHRQGKLMFAADRGRPQRSYQYNWLNCVLPEELPTRDSLAVSMRVFVELPPEMELTLRLVVDNLQANDEVAVVLNGTPIQGWRRAEENVLEAEVTTDELRVGENRFELRLADRAETSNEPRTATALELHASSP
ncbi:MAG: hypothetical protein DWQ34_12720 [Planctomycetota bacterium]|nr:MAG: hypothetical protein DWQ34_12720 [Planctomycetota bacterium]REK19905.1 MAG: hypothetical protein DWQ41_26600 [Planctomycetota bacterium]REK27470.1 MAG: hypothetical protein DWQ45_25615 [Planctomycetota bacterium]